MNKLTNAKEIINKLNLIISTPNLPADLNYTNLTIQSFKYDENIRSEEDSHLLATNPSITLYGDEIEKYNKLFEELYKELKVRNKKISLKSFKQRTQQLFFKNSFSLEKINEWISNAKVQTYYNVMKIYGMDQKDDMINIGKYTFLKKDRFLNHIKLNVENSNQFVTDFSLNLIEQDNIKESSFIYLIIPYETYDTGFARDLFKEESDDIINILRYMAGIKQERIYISNKEFITNFDLEIQFTDKVVLTGTKINRKDIEIDFDTLYFNSEENGNSFIWRVLEKANKTELEHRILKAIRWVGISIYEQMNNIASTELTFAYESLLKLNMSNSPITPSIQGSIAELSAFISGKSLEERLEIIQDFKSFYAYRSAVAHGGETKYDNSLYFKMLYLLKNIIINILTDEKYKKCNSLDDLYNVVNKYKYRVS